ncbi:MBL fold metallo-hydrolase [Roseomonas eburnea]|uniref:MBL fold metallo-hydrolase n=1 Tax=Neoroseomonas eburnea TaxID=1346889 RepID=A0A9X9X8X0_9PROT|nr:MBL fold metallo-hydrolase [Neoroseomonas eburnea]MBR0680156.1 MBL fold metallo-hydrolase [Neoroseomonas eburnea]
MARTARSGTRRQAAPRTAAAPRRRRAASDAAAQVRIRMYRQGLGDCFLVTLPRSDGKGDAFRIMIDCGVLLGTPGAKEKMQDVVADIAQVSGGRVDLLLVTHEHWDHVSGFMQAQEAFKDIAFGAVWMGWTESPTDLQAKRLAADRHLALAALRLADNQLRLAGAAEVAEEVTGLLGFFGVGGGGASTTDALDAARALVPPDRLRYAEPGEAPTLLAGTGARLYVLGPPRDETLLLRSDPSRKKPETYDLAFGGFAMEAMMGASGETPPDGPFADRLTIPMEVARAMPEFHRYWSDGTGGAGEGEAWRRIDGDWLNAAADLALRLDHDTNNTSLAVAIELDNGEVLLFAADAQVGNWLSWEKLEWEVEGRRVSGPDLLARSVFYKVGHHGSHNATLREKGLETMARLRVAAIPVDEAIARKRRWTSMPLPSLLERLEERTRGRVLRTDRPAPAGIGGLEDAALFFDFPP